MRRINRNLRGRGQQALVRKSLAQQVAALFAAGEQGIWLDPSDFSTMFQDSAGTIPVTAVEQPVGLILDKSGNGNHASQATATSRPVLKIDGNGKYYLKFDGVDDSLATAAINFTATDKLTTWVGVRILAESGFSSIFESGVTDDNAGSFGLFEFNTDHKIYFRARGVGLSRQVASGAISVPSTLVLTGKADIAGDILSVSVNSVNTPSAPDMGTGNFANYVLYIGVRTPPNTSKLNGNLYSLIIRGAASTAAQITSGEQYCATKAGVTL